MRIHEIILESDTFGTPNESIEDEADTRGDAALITALELLRHQADQSGAVTPRVKVNTVIERVRDIPGNEAFNFAALDGANQHNEAVKALIKDIKDDPKTGDKYIYLSPPENTVDDSDPLGARSAPAGDPSKIVSKMAAKAAAK